MNYLGLARTGTPPALCRYVRDLASRQIRSVSINVRLCSVIAARYIPLEGLWNCNNVRLC